MAKRGSEYTAIVLEKDIVKALNQPAITFRTQVAILPLLKVVVPAKKRHFQMQYSKANRGHKAAVPYVHIGVGV